MIFNQYKITALSIYALYLLNKVQHGTIHSIYRKTINLSFGGQLLALQASGSPLSPVSLITELTAESLEHLPLESGTPVTIQNGFIHLGPVRFSFQSPDVCPDLHFSAVLSDNSLKTLEKNCLCSLQNRDAGSFELLFSDSHRVIEIPFLPIARMRLTDTETFLRNRKWMDAAHTLCRLIGLGTGLTPGGDDFLCGVLAGLILCNLSAHPFSPELSGQIYEHLTDTNDISATFLACALEGQFSQAVNRLPYLNSSAEILSLFEEIGHSSGTDTLCGIYYILKNRTLFYS